MRFAFVGDIDSPAGVNADYVAASRSRILIKEDKGPNIGFVVVKDIGVLRKDPFTRFRQLFSYVDTKQGREGAVPGKSVSEGARIQNWVLTDGRCNFGLRMFDPSHH